MKEHSGVWLCPCVKYRAGTSIYRGLIKLLSYSEGDVGGADCGRGFNGQRLSVLRDFHQRLGGCRHRDHTQHLVHT